MAIQTIERQGYIDCASLAEDLYADFIANGFILKHPATITGAGSVTLEAGPTVDPLHAPTLPLVAQPYRIRFESSVDELKMFAATDIQLPDTGTVATYPVSTTVTFFSGLVGVQQESAAIPAQHFIDRREYTSDLIRESFPMSYKVTFTDRGFVLAIWENAKDPVVNRMSWIVVQRSVDNVTGAVTGLESAIKKAPVFAVYSIFKPSPAVANPAIAAVNVQQKFVVREIDVLRPTESVNANADSADNRQIVPTSSLVSILENGSYNVNFLSGLNSQRYAYPQDELDLVAYTSADVISSSLVATFTAYGEPTARRYKALPSNAGNNTNVRIMLLDSQV